MDWFSPERRAELQRQYWGKVTFVKAPENVTYRNLTRMSPEKKKIAWAWIKQHQPALAEMLETDHVLKELIERFNANVLLEVTLRKGKRHGKSTT